MRIGNALKGLLGRGSNPGQPSTPAPKPSPVADEMRYDPAPLPVGDMDWDDLFQSELGSDQFTASQFLPLMAMGQEYGFRLPEAFMAPQSISRSRRLDSERSTLSYLRDSGVPFEDRAMTFRSINKSNRAVDRIASDQGLDPKSSAQLEFFMQAKEAGLIPSLDMERIVSLLNAYNNAPSMRVASINTMGDSVETRAGLGYMLGQILGGGSAGLAGAIQVATSAIGTQQAIFNQRYQEQVEAWKARMESARAQVQAYLAQYQTDSQMSASMLQAGLSAQVQREQIASGERISAADNATRERINDVQVRANELIASRSDATQRESIRRQTASEVARIFSASPITEGYRAMFDKLSPDEQRAMVNALGPEFHNAFYRSNLNQANAQRLINENRLNEAQVGNLNASATGSLAQAHLDRVNAGLLPVRAMFDNALTAAQTRLADAQAKALRAGLDAASTKSGEEGLNALRQVADTFSSQAIALDDSARKRMEGINTIGRSERDQLVKLVEAISSGNAEILKSHGLSTRSSADQIAQAMVRSLGWTSGPSMTAIGQASVATRERLDARDFARTAAEARIHVNSLLMPDPKALPRQ